MTDEMWLQLWSGTFGAVVGSIFGAGVAILVLYLTNKKTTELHRKSLEAQAEQSRLQLAAQKDERRETREIEAVAALLDYLAGPDHFTFE